MADPLTEICQWARSQPAWEQETLRRLLAGEPLDASIYPALAELMLEGKSAKAVDLSPYEKPAIAQCTEPPVLITISGAKNINALVEDQSITFGPALTIVFGGNASGKSGYARLFGSVCFTRGDKDVLPNLTQPGCEEKPQTATLTMRCGDDEKTIHYALGSAVPELTSFYVFDSTCVSAHLTQANILSFAPAGLSVLQELVEQTDAVRDFVQQQINSARAPHPFIEFFPLNTSVRAAVTALNSHTDPSALHSLATLSNIEAQRWNEVDSNIAKLKHLDVPKAMGQLRQEIDLLRRLILDLQYVEDSLGDAKLNEIVAAIMEVVHRRLAAEKAGANQFKTDGLKSVGTGAWTEFIFTAKLLADAESGDAPYPRDDSKCLLCQQELSPDAVALLHRLWEFLEGEAKRRLSETETRLSAHREALEQLRCSLCEPWTLLHRALEQANKEELSNLKVALATAQARRTAALAAADDPAKAGSLVELIPQFPPSCGAALGVILQQWEKRLDELEISDPAKEISLLQKELDELTDRQRLATHLPTIRTHLARLKWAEVAETRLNTSRHITTKYNELFNERVTDEYRKTFEDFLARLGRPVNARIATRGQKGTALKTLELILPEGVTHPKAQPSYVFSEGEKRALVLADFLTEVSLDPNSAGVIFDDPVTSLDAEWKETIARVLVDEAARRQVLVFTHDLQFLYLLKRFSDASSIDLVAHWIRKGTGDRLPGYIFLNNSPASEKDYRTTTVAGRHLDLARKTNTPEQEEHHLRQGFAALRTTYEVFVLHDLFADVVQRFDERISIDRLKNAHLDPTSVDTVVRKVGELSRFIEGHSHSDANAARPTCDLLANEISAFDVLKGAHRKSKTTKASSGVQGSGDLAT